MHISINLNIFPLLKPTSLAISVSEKKHLHLHFRRRSSWLKGLVPNNNTNNNNNKVNVIGAFQNAQSRINS